MNKLRYILGLYAKGSSKQHISLYSGIARMTVRKYLEEFERSGLSFEQASALSDTELNALLVKTPEQPINRRLVDLYSFLPTVEKQLKRKGMTRELLWKEYIIKHPDGYQLSQFRHYWRQWKAQTSPSMHMEHIAGEKMYVDFAGDKLKIIDPDTAQLRPVEVFVAILGASQLIYVEAVASQKKDDFISACTNCMHYYGGAPKVIVPDNLRAAVTKTSKYEPEINRSFEDFARYYGMDVIPARAYKPKDKALVEGAVKIVYTRIYTKLDSLRATSLEQLNQALWDELEELNSSMFKGRSYSRRQQFNEIERDVLAPLPASPYQIRNELRATVMKSGHVAHAVDKHYYSVPYTFIGKKAKILYSTSTVDVYFGYELIASHKRSRRAYGYTTNDEHLASKHKFVTEWSADRFLGWAAAIGVDVQLYILKVFEQKQHPEQAYRTCMGILSFAKKYGNERLIRACRRALEYGTYNYSTIRTILQKGLDALNDDEECDTGVVPEHDNIRGGQYYQTTDLLINEEVKR